MGTTKRVVEMKTCKRDMFKASNTNIIIIIIS